MKEEIKASSEIVREFSQKQIAELKTLLNDYEITHLGRVDGDGRIICEYMDVCVINNRIVQQPKVVTISR